MIEDKEIVFGRIYNAKSGNMVFTGTAINVIEFRSMTCTNKYMYCGNRGG